MAGNPHTFPLVPLTQLAPELALRSGMGGWEPFALAAPSDRLLPFALAIRRTPSTGPWLDCAWVVNDTTGQKLAVLVPTGSQSGVPVPPLGLVLTRQDTADAYYFTYDGAPVPGLADLLPCGVPLRLIVNNAYQSPLFTAVGKQADLPGTYLRVEWFHPGPLSGVPYGRGFRQVLYIENGALTDADPLETSEAQKDVDTGAEVVLSYTAFARRAFTLGPTPLYLTDALRLAKAHRTLLADGQPWKLVEVKATPAGADGGRQTVVGTLQDLAPFQSRGCDVQPLPVHAYDPATDVSRGYRCGDTTDTASDYRPTGSYACVLNNGQNTGEANVEYKDVNPYSPTFGQSYLQLVDGDSRCPVPVTYRNVVLHVSVRRNNCPSPQVGSVVTYTVPAAMFTSTVSQAAADAQALAYANANKQAYANANGTCLSSRTITITDYTILDTAVNVRLTRSDSQDDVQVTVEVEAQVGNAGQPASDATSQVTITIPDGNDTAEGTASFGSTRVRSVDSATITGTVPGGYSF